MATPNSPAQMQVPAASLLDLCARNDHDDGTRRITALGLPSALVAAAASCAAAHGWRPDTLYLGAWALAQSRWTGVDAVEVEEWPTSRRQRVDGGAAQPTGAWLASIDAARTSAAALHRDSAPAVAWGVGPASASAAPRLQLGLDAAAPRLLLARNAGLLDEATAAEVLEAVAAIAERLADPASWRMLSDIPSLSPRQREQQRTQWNRPPMPGDPTATVVSLFARQVAERPEATALTQGGESLSYAELDRRATRLASRLQAAGAAPGDVVGVAIDRSILSVVALLAVLRTGAAYLPLQSTLPDERLAFMVGDAGVHVIVSTTERADRLPPCARVICADDPADTVAEGVAVQVAPLAQVAIDADALACVIYTSGSTGTPKGTEVLHRGIVRLVIGSDCIELSPAAVVLHSVPLGLDVSTAEIWGPLLNGGNCVVHDETMLTGPGLARSVAAHGVTTAFIPVALFNTLVDGDPMHLGGLRQVFIGGEAISVPHVRRALAALPDVRFVNAYGPTECTTIATAYPIPASLPSAAMTLPIGRPIADTTAFVTGPTLELLPAGLIGELCLGGRGVARGYVGRPELTAERFVPDPFAPAGRLYRTGDRARLLPDGQIDFLGRQDGQIKIRGHRIEIGEIEAALAAQPGLSANCVVGVKDASGNARLVAYLVAKADAPPWETLRSALAAQLPEVMVPTAHVWLNALPLNVNGKVDRRALPAPSAERPDTAQPYEAPRGAIEQRVADAFARALGIDRVGRRDNFFALGGDSLRVLKVLADLQKDHTRPLAPQLVFGAPTPLDLVAALAENNGTARPASRHARPAGGSDDAIAVIAMAGRFPGAANVEALWESLLAGNESIRHFDEAELDPWVTPALRADPAYVRARGVIDDVDLFDAAFFGISAREAELTDPQQRIFLELSWECLERAGYVPDATPGTVGVYGGMNNGTYLQRHLLPRADLTDAVGEVMLTVANEKDYVATRVAHRLDLTGPAISIHTACSTSLVAIAQAFDALRSGACDMALAGGVSITCPPRSGYLYQEGAMLSPDGHTRSFDADARGTVFSDGAAVVLLKPLARALEDGDTVCAVLRGAAVNNDGAHKASFTAPSAAGQAAVIAAALDSAGVSARDISYVEAHGTATPVGDPIEIEGLTRAFARDTADTGFCAIGSLKSNVGHMVTAAGAAGLIKTVMALEAGRIPATVNFARPHPGIDFAVTPFRVAAAAIDWPRTARPRLAGVSSFGIGGTNAHVIVEEAPLRAPAETDASPQVLLLSARTPAALAAAAERLAAHLDAHPAASLADVAYTLRVGRKAFAHRLAVVADSAAAASAALRAADAPQRTAGSVPAWQHQGVLLFPGQGAQYAGMGRTLHAAEPVFRAAFDEVLRAFDGVLDVDLRERMASDDPAALKPTAVTQPATFAFEYAMARQLLATRLAPAALIGHSVGEFVAAVLAGVMPLADAARLVARRGALMQALPAGAMLSVRMPAEQLLARLPPGLSLAADNAPMACVAAGPAEGIAQLQVALEAEGIAVRRLQTSHAFHSSMMAAAVAPFEALVREARLSAPRLPIYSTLTGRLLTAEEAVDPGYWARHLREPVRFAGAVQAALGELDHPLFVEVGPRNTLATLVRQQATRQRPVQAVSTGSERSGDERHAWRLALARLWTLGAELDLGLLDTRARPRRVRLPTYPFERKRFWIDAPARNAVQPVEAAAALIGTIAQPVFSGTDAAADAAPSPKRAASDARLRRLLESITGLEAAQVDGGTPFVELGLDSLALAQLAVQVQKTFGVALSFRQLMEGHRSIDALAAFIDGPQPTTGTPTMPSTNEPAARLPVAATPAAFSGFTLPASAAVPAPSAPPARPAALTARQSIRLQAFVQRYLARTPSGRAPADGATPGLRELERPIAIDRTEGARLHDADGNGYVDTFNHHGDALFGWRPAFVDEAIRTQLAPEGARSTPALAAEVAQRICALTGFDRALLCGSASDAVAKALQIARALTGRNRVAVFAGAAHTDSGPHDVLGHGAPGALEVLRAHAGEFAAVLIEPVQALHPERPPREFLQALRAITAASGTLLVVDEVMGGFRADRGGVQALCGVRADLAVYGGVAGGGFALGAIAATSAHRDAIEAAADAHRPGMSPLALAAARAVLARLHEDNNALPARLTRRTAEFADTLNAFCRRVGAPIEIRHFASLWRVAWLAQHPLQSLLFPMMRGRGVHIVDDGPCFLTAAHSPEDIAAMASAFQAAVAEMQEAEFLPGRTTTALSFDAAKPPVPHARLGRDKDMQPAWFVPDPAAPGKYMKFQA